MSLAQTWVVFLMAVRVCANNKNSGRIFLEKNAPQDCESQSEFWRAASHCVELNSSQIKEGLAVVTTC
jgi:hypothetical protein